MGMMAFIFLPTMDRPSQLSRFLATGIMKGRIRATNPCLDFELGGFLSTYQTRNDV